MVRGPLSQQLFICAIPGLLCARETKVTCDMHVVHVGVVPVGDSGWRVPLSAGACGPARVSRDTRDPREPSLPLRACRHNRRRYGTVQGKSVRTLDVTRVLTRTKKLRAAAVTTVQGRTTSF